MRRALVASLALLSACATDPRMVAPLAERPLVAAPDTGAVTLGGGVSFARGNPRPAFDFVLEAGLTEGVALHFPLAFMFGGELDDAWSLALVGGLTDVEVGNTVYLTEVPDDPRLPAQTVYVSNLAFGGGPLVRWRAGDDTALTLSARAAGHFYGLSHVSLRAHAGASVVHDLGPWVSVRAGVGYTLRGEPAAPSERYTHQAGATGSLVLHFDGFDASLTTGVRVAPSPLDPVVLLGYTYLF